MNRNDFFFLAVLAVFGISGCGGGQDYGLESATENITVYIDEEKSVFDESKELAESYQDIYEAAVNSGALGNMEVMQSIIDRIGEAGYAAVDTENQINMANCEQAEQFCKQAQEKKEAGLTLIAVMQNADFIRYDFETADGKINIRRSTMNWKSGVPEEGYKNEYPVYTWFYSEEGYFFFEEYHPEGYDGPSGHTAVRIKPLNEKCRELNRRYLLPVGYVLNNIFTCDWDENDYGELNFYDLYEIMYQMKYESQAIQTAGENDVVYEIPADRMENVFMTYFKIDSGILRKKMDYNEEQNTYPYRPRGSSDIASTPLIPCPEVIAYEENPDGTVTLTVNAVWKEKKLAKAFSHEVVIRPLADGGFQYVSNQMIPSADSVEPTWYTPREAAFHY